MSNPSETKVDIPDKEQQPNNIIPNKGNEKEYLSQLNSEAEKELATSLLLVEDTENQDKEVESPETVELLAELEAINQGTVQEIPDDGYNGNWGQVNSIERNLDLSHSNSSDGSLLPNSPLNFGPAVISGDGRGLVVEDRVFFDEGLLTIFDPTPEEAFFQSVIEGLSTNGYGLYSIYSHGAWEYFLDNEKTEIQGLAEDQIIYDSFTVYSADNTPFTVVITIMGTNDIPVIGYTELSGIVIEDQTPDILTESGIINFIDIDLIDTHLISVNYLDSTYDQQLGNLLTILTVAATGGNVGEITWTFIVDNALVQFLPQDMVITETYLVSVDDDHGGIDNRIINIDIIGVNDEAIFDGQDTGLVKEDEILTDTGLLTVFDVDLGETGFVPSNGLSVSAYGSYTFDINGNWNYTLTNSLPAVQALAEGQEIYDSIIITSLDGTEKEILITIEGTNDAPVIDYTELTGAVTEDENPLELTDSGILNFTDIDLIDGHTVEVEFINSTRNFQLGSMIAIINANATGGNLGEIEWTFNVSNEDVQFIRDGDIITETYLIRVNDGNGGIDERTVSVDIIGVNDVPIISGNSSGTVKEDETLSDSGTLTINDVDENESAFQANTNIASNQGYGTASIDTDGNWVYNLNNTSNFVQRLAVNETLNDSFNVLSVDGTMQVVNITIDGTNDIPVIGSADLNGLVVENTTSNPPVNLTDFGLINFTDVDFTDAHIIGVTYLGTTHSEQLGNLLAAATVIATGGNTGVIRWDFSVLNADIVFLEKNQNIRESYRITIDDGNGGVVTTVVDVDLRGGNHIPTIGGDSNGVVREDMTLTDSGVLTISDLDPGENSFQAATFTGVYGNLNINTSGLWTYTLSNNASHVQALAQGESHTDFFYVYSADGTAHAINVIVNGTNDNPFGLSDSYSFSLNVVAGPPGDPILNFVDFSDTSNLEINGHSSVANTNDGTVMRMVSTETSQSGSVFSTDLINANEFSTYFQFRMTDGGGFELGNMTYPGADGLVFVIQTVSNAAYSAGGQIGYGGLSNSVGVEFDTWLNGVGSPQMDPNDRHAAILTNGDTSHGPNTPTYSLPSGVSWDNGAKWHVWIDYNNGVLEVRANTSGSRPSNPILSSVIDIADIIGSNSAYIGFTSATGAAYHNTDILYWTYQDSYTPGGPTVTTGTTTGNVLWNDGDIDNFSSISVGTVNGDAASVGQTITLTSGALLTLQANGDFFYDSNGAFNINPGQVATDSFVYQVRDNHGTLSLSTTATITMTAQSAPPVVIDLNNDGSIDLSAVSEGIQYDIDGDGSNEQVSWVGANDGILIFDLHSDGQVTEAKEFVFTMWDENAQTDMEALRNVFDTNGDGALTNEDESWAQFGIWQDKNGDGISDEGEFFTLDELGFERLDLLTDEVLQHLNGNTIHGVSQLHHKDGYSVGAYDVSLKYVDVIAEPPLLEDAPTAQESPSPNESISSDLPPLANDSDFSAPSLEANLAHDMEMQQQNTEAFG